MPNLPVYDQDYLWQSLSSRFFDVAATVGDCIAIALRDTPGTSYDAKMRVCYPNFGGLAWDDCDCGGVLQVSMGRRTSTVNFPQELSEIGANRPTACGAGSPMQDFTVEFIRCWPGPDNRGRPPSCHTMVEATRKLDADITAIRKAMYDCLCEQKQLRHIDDYVIRASQPAGPEGSCAGWTTNFSVSVVTLG